MNYKDAFISVAPDGKAKAGTVPPPRGAEPTVACLEHQLLAEAPYAYTQEALQFEVHLRRLGLPEAERPAQKAELWEAFFSKPMACLRGSPLPKTYGWGLHFDGRGHVGLVGVESAEYARLSKDPCLQQLTAFRNRRA